MDAYTAVLFYIVWMLVLTLIYAFPRVPLALLGKKSIDSWERGKENPDPMFMQRAKSAHMNCVENFPLFAGVVVVAGLLGQIEVANAVAAFVLYARVAQSLIHISGTSFVQVMARATFFLIQVVLIFYMAFSLIG